MVMADGVRMVMVLTQRPGDIGAALAEPGLKPVHAADVDELLAALQGRPVSGFALDVDMVLRAPVAQRELLYHLSQVFPLLRLRRKGQAVVCLDDAADFRAAALGFAPREARHEPRSPVLLRGLLEGPGAAEGGLPADILDVSSQGGLLSANRPLKGDLPLRILDIADQSPVTARVCWSRPPGRGSRHGAGVRFLDIRPGQAGELTERFLLRRGARGG